MSLFRIAWVLVLLNCAVCRVDARVLTPYEQAVGQWVVTLTSNGWRRSKVPSMLFPSLKTAANELPCETNTMHCHLSVFSNGTFVMDAPSNLASTRMSLRGQWKLQPNPYCITDRQYDQLVLESYPRVQKRAFDEQVLQRVILRLQCRVWGRYGSGPIRQFLGFRSGRIMSRMTHGTIVWNVQQSQETNLPWWKSRRVCASFTAKPIESPGEGDDEDFDFDDE